MPDLERDVERLLRKTFFLDCLVRNAGPYATTLSELSLLEALEIDAETLYEASPQDRLATYLDVPYAAIKHRLPGGTSRRTSRPSTRASKRSRSCSID